MRELFFLSTNMMAIALREMPLYLWLVRRILKAFCFLPILSGDRDSKRSNGHKETHRSHQSI